MPDVVPQDVIGIEEDALASARLVVIIPSYRHPVLLTEALDSVLAQTIDVSLAIIICSDGCPLPETDTVAKLFSRADSRVIYLRKPNGGPSSARNFAIDYALGRFPKMDVVYFLDSDNRLTPTALATGYQSLMQSPELGWVYPHIDSFGITWSGNYAVPYSPLLHVIHENFCDTGSFVRRAVFDAGIRFNEDARSGFEDWDFWLQCLSSGFRGRHVLFGFSYRQRPESRYREMNRLRGQVLEHLKQRHWAIAAPKNLIRWEHETNPRYLLALDAGRYVAFTDPLGDLKPVDGDQFAADIWAYAEAPDVIWAPAFYLFGDQQVIDELGRVGLLRNLLWLMERKPFNANFAVVTLDRAEGEVGLKAGVTQTPRIAARRAQLWLCTHKQLHEILADGDDGWVNSLASEWPGPTIYEVNVAAPFTGPVADPSLEEGTALDLMLETIKSWRESVYRSVNRTRWIWRPMQMPARHTYYSKMCDYLGTNGFMPRVARTGIDVGVVVPIASYGGSEKVAYALAQLLRRIGRFSLHLFVVGAPRMKILSEYTDAFDTINFLADEEFPSWGGNEQVFGEPCFMPESPQIKTKDVVGFLGGLDLIINCQSAPLNSLMGALRQQKVKTISYLHLADITAHGRPAGHPYITLGFEHVYDLLVTCSRRLADDLHALGIPGDKIIPISNAASFRITPEIRAEARIARALPRAGRKLRCLYIGRLDRQKGIERLIATMRQAMSEHLSVEFQLIGSSLVDNSSVDWLGSLDQIDITIRPAIYSTGELTQAYLWADVLLLPSRWEGAPLVIPECQQLGAIPICTDVGAVAEMIRDGIDGMLIADGQDSVVSDDMVEALKRLTRDDEMRYRIAQAAIDRGETNLWENNFKPLVDWIEDAFELPGDI